MNSLPNMLMRASRLNPDGIGMICSGREYTWKESQVRIARHAGGGCKRSAWKRASASGFSVLTAIDSLSRCSAYAGWVVPWCR